MVPNQDGGTSKVPIRKSAENEFHVVAAICSEKLMERYFAIVTYGTGFVEVVMSEEASLYNSSADKSSISSAFI
jgi:hypothetical protein